MPTSLSFDEHVAALEAAGERLVTLGEQAGLDANVPTCPEWDVRALLAHQTMVHRWATGIVTKETADALNQTTIRNEVADITGYYREGLAALLAALRDAPGDLEVMTFLNDAPAPREFWARRQAHETTMHMVDAHAALLGRAPTAAEAAIGTTLAADGVDELLRGFFTRGKSKLFDGQAFTIAVRATDAGRAWTVHVDERLTVEPGEGGAAPVDATLHGPSAALYLALWNRSDDGVATEGRPDVLERWHAAQRVRWS
jgi:uncharacterized protein (TIGR03083 family)